MTVNYLKLEFLSLACNQAFARDAVAAFCVYKNPSLSVISDIKTAVSEAVANCAVHAYGGEAGPVVVECDMRGDLLHISVTDRGRGIEDVQTALQPFYTTLPGDERSGMGFTIMQTFMDEFSVQSQRGEGTVVRMAKQLNAEVENV